MEKKQNQYRDYAVGSQIWNTTTETGRLTSHRGMTQGIIQNMTITMRLNVQRLWIFQETMTELSVSQSLSSTNIALNNLGL